MDEPLACDRIGILREGSLLIEDTPDNILSLGKTELTVKGDMGTVVEEMRDYSQELPQLLKPYGLKSEITSISLKQDSLEDVFLKIVEGYKKYD